jgi:CheY-like chemotaxis protein/signal transduction histidine kinase
MKQRILVIEDNQANMDLVRYLLEASGYECVGAVDGPDALRSCETAHPDLVICDLQLPGMDGFAVLQRLRERPGMATVPIVAVTAYAMVGDRERILAAGFDGYIAKPLDPEAFGPQIAGFLARSAAPSGSAPAEPGAGSQGRILVVDDRAPNRELLRTVLQYYGFTVDEAANGAAALAQIAARRPDLVITDLLMPNMDGEEMCRRLRADSRTANLPVIIHTASFRARQARQIAEQLGVRWVLPKPSEPAAIIATVAAALGREVPHAVAADAAESAEGEANSGRTESGKDELMERNRQLTRLLSDAIQLAEVQGRTLADAGVAENLESLAARLTSLVHLGLDVALERDPEGLVELFCTAAQDLLSARYVGIVILDPGGKLRKFAARGLDQRVREAVAGGMLDCPAALRLLQDAPGPAMLVAAHANDATGLPAAHPAVHTMLACTAAAHGERVGWIYVADRLGGEGFDADDERLLLALGGMLASSWGRLMVLDDLDRRVAQRTGELELANQELKAFSSVVSHDLQTPLDHIDGYAKALKDRLGASADPQVARYVGKIGQNVGLMKRLIGDLLHVARTSHLKLSATLVDFDEVMAECRESFADEIARRGIRIVAGRLGSHRADRALIAQVMLNLLGNAVKFTRNEPKPLIEFGLRVVDAEMLFFIRDNGSGFDMAYADRLFGAFERLHSANEFEGSGVGLALVKQIVARHGGRVWAEGAPGQGACFYVAMPETPARTASA